VSTLVTLTSNGLRIAGLFFCPRGRHVVLLLAIFAPGWLGSS
jgi:hypothetical protein